MGRFGGGGGGGEGERERERSVHIKDKLHVMGSGVGSEGSRLEAWTKSHKSEVAIT